MKISNMVGRSGKPVANQFVIEAGKVREFWSYNSTIVRVEGKQVFLDATYWDYSRTTAKYRNKFLGDTSAEVKQKIASGEYTLADLNGE